MWMTILRPLAAASLVASPALGQSPPDSFQDELYRALAEVDRVTPETLVVQAVRPAVVYIETEITQRVRSIWGQRDQTFNGSGSGVVINSDGYIVTNYHVVKEANAISVSFDRDPQRYPAELVSFVRSEDLALLKIERPATRDGQDDAGFPTVRMGTSVDLMEGERVVAIGNPHGQTHTVSTGIISGLHRDVPIPEHGLHFQDLIQTDASINFGNSGGPLLNIRGELIGINSAMNSQAENIGFAIPVDRVREVLTDILFPQARRSWVGLILSDAGNMQVADVVADSPADMAGICAGDRLLAIGGTTLTSMEDYLHSSLELEPDSVVELTLQKANGQRQRVDVTTWDRVDGILFERLGLTVREERIASQRWVLVDRISGGGPADALGLRTGDLIPAIRPKGGRFPTALRIRDRKTLAQVVSRLETGAHLDLDVYRDDNRDRGYSGDELYQGVLKLR